MRLICEFECSAANYNTKYGLMLFMVMSLNCGLGLMINICCEVLWQSLPRYQCQLQGKVPLFQSDKGVSSPITEETQLPCFPKSNHRTRCNAKLPDIMSNVGELLCRDGNSTSLPNKITTIYNNWYYEFKLQKHI